ncbi:MAG: adenosine deaminase, partial [Acidobacteriota bacterium]|nr:adenosine deaminase [Acidobacteriota bacterium]
MTYRPFLLCSALTICLRPSAGATRPAQSVDQLFNTLRNSPPELYAFLLRMPKGADLHNHLSGA